MDLAASMRALRRQWILASVLLILTFVAGMAAWVKMPGPYSTESMVVLLPSQQASKLNGNNPYESYGGSESVAGDIVLRQVMDPAVITALANKGYTASYAIADDPNTSGPILDITVTGNSAAEVENTLRGVTNEVQTKLIALQSFLVPANRITSMVASFDPTAKLEVSKKARDVVLIVGLGLVLTYALPQILDANIRRRRGDDRESGYAPPPSRDVREVRDTRDVREDEQVPSPYQQPHRRRYRPVVDEPESMPMPPVPVPADERPPARPYVERPRGGERVASPAPVDADVPATQAAPSAPADRRSSRETARRREFTY
jgi:hypothetical protein